ncbi:FHA domain-containing protein [Nymphaea thermarum]|nr:FHA domain-containing protein [Nymphaea thermarum]
MSAMDLVLGVYARNKHLQDIVLILGSEINQERRMEVWTAGRNPNCGLVIQHPSIRGFHFELEVDKVKRRVWVTNLTLIGKLSVAEILIRPQFTEQFYPGDILKVGDSNWSFKLEVIPSVSGQEEASTKSRMWTVRCHKQRSSFVRKSLRLSTQQLCEKIINLGMVQGSTLIEPLGITYMAAVGGAGGAAKVEKGAAKEENLECKLARAVRVLRHQSKLAPPHFHLLLGFKHDLVTLLLLKISDLMLCITCEDECHRDELDDRVGQWTEQAETHYSAGYSSREDEVEGRLNGAQEACPTSYDRQDDCYQSGEEDVDEQYDHDSVYSQENQSVESRGQEDDKHEDSNQYDEQQADFEHSEQGSECCQVEQENDESSHSNVSSEEASSQDEDDSGGDASQQPREGHFREYPAVRRGQTARIERPIPQKLESWTQPTSRSPLDNFLPAGYTLREEIRKLQTIANTSVHQPQRTASHLFPIEGEVPTPTERPPKGEPPYAHESHRGLMTEATGSNKIASRGVTTVPLEGGVVSPVLVRMIETKSGSGKEETPKSTLDKDSAIHITPADWAEIRQPLLRLFLNHQSED